MRPTSSACKRSNGVVQVVLVIPQVGIETDPSKRLKTRWGSNIASARELRSMSRAALSEAVGVSDAAVGMWERGETAPRWHHQLAIAQALQVPHAVLFAVEAA